MSRQLSGFRAWMWQRASAIYLAGFIVYVLAWLMFTPPGDHEVLKYWLAGLGMWLATALFFLALLLHAWIGVRDVILDYVKLPGLRLAALATVFAFLLTCGLWVASILMGLL
ncbi:MAG TPA: succinate dehydrogenase, hydrophobic membrane anchor protein [Thiolapillus brandeum]|uniref:Succinate dehydrogenase hydrophobic membrane anchor subunit n=1 Tax=Thiolapillus brandeum TaxID=1076588 RepID=A0A831RWZ5_9GAMM|nr:succinate dehydrogenase, hydrophobic membrane anchor protein [Thiolapillus brandeum]